MAFFVLLFLQRCSAMLFCIGLGWQPSAQKAWRTVSSVLLELLLLCLHASKRPFKVVRSHLVAGRTEAKSPWGR